MARTVGGSTVRWLPQDGRLFGVCLLQSVADAESSLSEQVTNEKLKPAYPYFDWLRFALASAVALGHEGIITWEHAGNFAVQVFFALSGWLIGGILLRCEPNNLSRFYFNRATRIWIPYVFAVAAIYLLGAARDGLTPNFFKFLFFDLTFTHNFFIEKIPEVTSTMPLEGTGTHLWSISVEEQFYLAAPLLIVFLRFGRTLWFWGLIAVVAYLTASWYASISLGVLAVVAQARFGDWHRRALSRVAFAVMSIGAIALAFVEPATYPWIAPPAAIGIVLLLSIPGERSPVGEFFGGMSYPFYLYHWVGMFAANFIAKKVALPSVGWTAYSIAVVVGAVAYVVVDRNIMRYRGDWYTPRRGWILAITAYTLFVAGLIGGWTIPIQA
ncbi:acyltransferase family protein [Sphingomonas mesophila]|uniref:acyltransferase family protein n=1 Tax=Sphingomonas mesophila TaxID=2303576 RepID=UPI000E567F90|nr:acyltransferase [Sphingomonas mesophila]